MAFGLDPTELY
nr:millepattes peptide 2 [Nasonia vitripennis]